MVHFLQTCPLFLVTSPQPPPQRPRPVKPRRPRSSRAAHSGLSARRRRAGPRGEPSTRTRTWAPVRLSPSGPRAAERARSSVGCRSVAAPNRDSSSNCIWGPIPAGWVVGSGKATSGFFGGWSSRESGDPGARSRWGVPVVEGVHGNQQVIVIVVVVDC